MEQSIAGVGDLVKDYREKLEEKDVVDLVNQKMKLGVGVTILRIPEHNVQKRVLVIYTGGTIGCAPKDRNDPDSPQVAVSWEELRRNVPELDQIKFPIDAISFNEPLDSCNVGPYHWKIIAETIKKYYKDYEGFVIVHGTDTMV